MRGRRELLGGLDDARAQRRRSATGSAPSRSASGGGAGSCIRAPRDGDRAVAVADDLHLDVARLADQPLDIDAVAAERGLGLGLAARIGLVELRGS